ncbi:hypothetical protein M2109_005195 [Paenibacillus sp. PastH-3]|nr:hypothetical protein [Paenibacillus sp. PastH-4]MDH6447038.1 hypothetical protein [Paenibacillus sp. PastF-4]MDH6530837.1 hypothetical protein [Paenibacillus sp. PastH-3]
MLEANLYTLVQPVMRSRQTIRGDYDPVLERLKPLVFLNAETFKRSGYCCDSRCQKKCITHLQLQVS